MRTHERIARTLGISAFLLAGAVVTNCGSVDDPSAFAEADGAVDPNNPSGDGGGGFGFGDTGTGEASRPCVGLECQQVACSGGGSTTLSGKVFAPEGTLPLYNAIVYVPNSKPEPFKQGIACEQCGQVTGSPVVTAITNEKGEFVLKNVPVGNDIPLVIQIGKWRRQITIPKVEKCVDTAVDAGMTRLPRKQSEGDIPLIAFSSGSADSLECFLRKLGIDDSEFTSPTGAGRVHFFKGNGSSLSGGSPAATTLWSDVNTLKKYDITMLSCEGSENTGNKAPYYAQLDEYLKTGGRVFASHYHYVWFKNGPAPLPTTAEWDKGVAGSSPFLVDTDFPKGNAFADWLVNVQASTTRGQIELSGVRDSVGDSSPTVSRRWIHLDTPKTAKYFSFNTPIGQPADKQCGRAVFTDVHVSGAGSTNTFPNFCNSNPLNTNEKALVFLFFDLSSCVQDENKPPTPPPAIPK